MTYTPKFHWDEDTLKAYKADVDYISYDEMKFQVEFFVSTDCQLEDSETEEDLVKDLLNQIYSDYDRTI